MTADRRAGGTPPGPTPSASAYRTTSASSYGASNGTAPNRTWPVVLDELEGDLQHAEEVLARNRAEEIAAWGRRSTDWVHPSGLGPFPEDLRERAARLLQHQLAVAEALVERITQSQRQRDVAARMSYAPTRPVASYIDRGL